MAPDRQTWILAGSGEIGGDGIGWRKGFEVIDSARTLLSLLEYLDEKKVNWRYLVAGLPRFSVLKTLSFPPLYSASDLDYVDGFLTMVKEPRDSAPGMSFVRIKIYVERKQQSALLQDFVTLCSRLRAYPALKDRIEDWM